MSEPTVLAVDVGGTSIKAGLVTRSGRVDRVTSVATPVSDGPDAVVAAVRDVVRTSLTSGTRAVGLVAPGTVDGDAGIAVYSANLGWRDVPLRQIIADDTDLPTVVDHDIRGGGLAEQLIGSARGVEDALVVVIGTGIAARVVNGGRLLHGATGNPGEIGHLPVWPDGEACPCGQTGCLERYASAAAISRRYAERSGRSASARDVAARLGDDEHANAVWQDATEALGIALASATMLLDPSLFVLAGGLSLAGEALAEPTRTALSRRVRWHDVPELRLSALGSQGPLLGAGILAWRRVGHHDVDSWSAR